MSKNYDRAVEEDAYRLFLLMNQTADSLRKLRQRGLESSGITMEQAAALISVKNLGDRATSSELAKWLFREPNTVTALVNGLEKRGLIMRTPSETNKKIKLLSVTEAGEEAYRAATDLSFLHDSVLRLSPKKREQLRAILELLKDETFRSLRLDAEEYTKYLNIPIDLTGE